MKNRKIRRVLSLLQLLVLTVQLAVVASATSSVTWVPAGGYTRVATVNKLSGADTEQCAIKSTQKYHTKGQPTYFPNGEYLIEYSNSFDFRENEVVNNSYGAYLTRAAEMEGLQEVLSGYYRMTGDEVVVPASATSGYYCIKAGILGNSGDYRVIEVRATGETVLTSGKISFAPFGTDGKMTGVVVAALPRN